MMTEPDPRPLPSESRAAAGVSNSAAQADAIDWSLTTFEGARREQMRRWAALPLVEIIRAQEDMEALARDLGL